MITIFNNEFESEEDVKVWFDKIVDKHNNFWTVLNFMEVVNCYYRGEVSKRIFDQITQENKLEAFIDEGKPIAKKDIWKFEKSNGGRVTEQEFDAYLMKKYIEKLEECYGSLLRQVRSVCGCGLFYSLPVFQKEKRRGIGKYASRIEREYEEVKNAYVFAQGIDKGWPMNETRRVLAALQKELDALKQRSSLHFDEMMDLLGYCVVRSPEERLLQAIFGDPKDKLYEKIGITRRDRKGECEAIELKVFKDRMAKLQDEVGNKKLIFIPIDGREIGYLLATRYMIADGSLFFLSDWVPDSEFDNVPDLCVLDGFKAAECAIEAWCGKLHIRRKCGEVLIAVDCGDEFASEYCVFEVLNEPIVYDAEYQVVKIMVRSKDRMFKIPSCKRGEQSLEGVLGNMVLGTNR